MSSGPSIDCHEAKMMEKQDSEEKKTMMMMMMEDDGSYPVQDQNEEDEAKKLSLEVAVDEEDTMMGAIETDLIFCDDAFPSLPDFPCLSSPSNAACPSSSSSSNSSSSSASSSAWAHNRQEEHHHRHQHEDGQASSSAIIGDINMKKDPLGSMDSDCSMYQLEGIDLLGSTDESWDPFSLFPDDGGTNDLNENEALFLEREDIILQHRNLEEEREREEGDCTSQELASVFLEWLRTNKETISPEDLRSIKLRRSTIESAARSLGGGKDGMKKLLKLILTWVQSNHLQKKRTRLSPSSPDLFNEEDLDIAYLYQQAQLSDLQEGNIQSNPCEAPYMGPSPAVQSFSPPSICSWSQQMPQYPLPSLYNQYEPSFSRLGSSATKEARKKRMARQRRFSSLHHSQNLHHHQRNHHHQSSQDVQQSNPALPGERICSQRDNHGSWGFRSSTSSSSQQVVVNGGATATSMSQQRLHDFPPGNAQDKRQGWRSEKNLRFLLQKVLKQSDVGSLGRIVLPKKEAETHLPELETRDGITLAMEDIVTSRTWNMRYRFWPNNKSRMYLLENTGEFVRSNGLQEGDFIVIYSDMKCGKYMIRGVKVRHSADPNIGGTTEPGTGR